MASDNVIPFAEAAGRVRRRGGPDARDALWMLAICCWPLALTVFAAQGALDALRRIGERT